MSGARCVVAINRDPEAPLFRSARYGIVSDLHVVVPELLAALTEEGAEEGAEEELER
jgi:electron transfer flavoprotein alpha subunit